MSEDTATTQETTPETTPELDPNMPKISFGFGILVAEDGGVFLEKSPQLFTVPVEREASLIEIRRYLSDILMDLQAQAAAEYTVLRLSASKDQA